MEGRNDTVDEIVDGFMRYVRKTPPFENVSITVAYATKLCHRIREAHRRETGDLRRLKNALTYFTGTAPRRKWAP